MSLGAGERLGPYEIQSLIGQGGMGEVYRAKDTRLGRVVAIKISRQQFNERFEREARVISALNHPNICALYDVGPDYLVMEYVSTADAAISPTITSPAMTHAGMILGTAAYMAPEQARGKAVDSRADIWAFGVVVYELLSGERPFKKEDLTETLAAVVKDPPNLDVVPARVRPLLDACLRKDSRKRLQSIGDVGLLLRPETAVSPASQPSARFGSGRCRRPRPASPATFRGSLQGRRFLRIVSNVR